MGSEETLTGKARFLDSASYENLSRRNQSTFADQRGDIYNIFEMYRKEKSRRREFDAADRYVRACSGADTRLIDGLIVVEPIGSSNFCANTVYLGRKFTDCTCQVTPPTTNSANRDQRSTQIC